MGDSSSSDPPPPSTASSSSSSGVVTSELLIPLVLCLVLLAGATAAQRVLKREAHPWHRHLRAVRIAQCVLSWYLVSISFTLWNKFVLRYWRGTGFPFPVFVTLLHMTTKLCITRAINAPCCVRPEKRIKPMPCAEAARGPIPIGVCTAMDVAFSNLSFLFISVTFYTILKASAVLWILAWASLLGLEALTWEVLAICGLVSTGVALASYGEAAFSWAGFFLVTAACALSGLRWALTQTMLEGKRPLGGGGEEGGIGGGGASRHRHHQQELSMSRSASRHRPLRGVDDSSGGSGNGTIGREEEVEVSLEMRDPTSSSSAAAHNYAPPSLGQGQQPAAPEGGAAASTPPTHSTSNGHGHGHSMRRRSRGSSSGSSSHHHGGHHHHHRPLEILYHISPASALSCLPVFLVFEAGSMWRSPFLATPALALELLAVLVLGGAFSFLLILAEVKLVKISSSLTMSMFGAVKEVITVALSMLAFHDAVSALNVLGLVVAISGAVWYRSYKLRGPSAVAATGAGAGGEGARPGWAPPQYLPAATGVFHLDEDSEEEEEEEEEEEGGYEGGGGRRGARGEQELRAVGRGSDVGLA